MSLFSDITIQVNLNWYNSTDESIPSLCKFIGLLHLKFNDRRLSLELNVVKPMMENDTGSFLIENLRKDFIFKRLEYNFPFGKKTIPTIPSYTLIQLGQLSEIVRLSNCQVVENSSFPKRRLPVDKQPTRLLELHDCEILDPSTLSKFTLQSFSSHKKACFQLDKWINCSYIKSLDIDEYFFIGLNRKKL